MQNHSLALAADTTTTPYAEVELSAARDTWFAGEFTTCLEILERVQPRSRSERVEAALLKARALLRLARAEEAVASLDGIDADVSADDERATVLMLRGAGAARLGKWELSDQLLTEARRFASAPNSAVRAVIGYYVALSRWMRGEYEAVEEDLREALDPSAEIIYARALELLGHVDLRQGRMSAAARTFSLAMNAIDRSKYTDGYVVANLLRTLSKIAVETIDSSIWSQVESKLVSFEWPTGAAASRLSVQLDIGLMAMINGDKEKSWRQFFSVAGSASSDLEKAVAETYLAKLMRFVGEEFTATQLLLSAKSHLEASLLAEAASADRSGILNFVIESANIGHGSATEMWAAYLRLDPISDTLAVAREDSLWAEERQAEAFIAFRAGDLCHARRLVRTAAMDFEARGYLLRAAMLASDWHKLAGDASLLPIMDRALARFPGSAIGSGSRSTCDPEVARADEIFPELTVAERKIAVEISRGKTSAQIAASLGRSANTVRNQTKNIYRTLGIHSRSGIAAEFGSRSAVAPELRQRA